MRTRASSLLAIGALALTVVASACSSDVTTEEPGTGGVTSATSTGAGMSGTSGVGGAPGTSSSSSSVTTANTGSSTTGSSVTTSVTNGAGGSGGSACDQACGHASQCGLDVCSFTNIDCATAGSQYDCFFACIQDGSCDDILALANQNFNTPLGACLQVCQGMGNGAGGGGGGPPPQSCQQCTFQSCGGEIQACTGDNAPGGCGDWAQCAQGCQGDSQCLFGCDMQFPNAAVGYQEVYSCLCANCDMACIGTVDPCGHLGP